MKIDKSNYPKGWYARKEFIDEAGNVYHKGKLQPQNSDVQNKEQFENPFKLAPEKSEVELLKNEVAELKRLIGNQQSPTVVVQQPEKEKKFGVRKNPENFDDYLDTPITYVMLGKGYVLGSYMKNGKEILAPFNVPIYFKLSSSDKKIVGDSEKLIHYSSYTTRSKAEVEFIEGSPLYERLILKSMIDTYKVLDTEYARRLESVIKWIEQLPKDQIFAQMIAYGIDKGLTVDKAKEKLINIKISEQIIDEAELIKLKQGNIKELEQTYFK